MYFKYITLKNFQGHENSRFELDNKFNCIIGENDQGKSSIVRALMFLYFDMWEKDWVRDGAEFAEVQIARDDGVVITRRKGETVNEVTIKENGKKEEAFNNFGKILPAAIKDKFKIRAVKLDISKEENLNIANQFDQPFLLFETGPTKLKILNIITGAHIVDVATRELNKDKKKLMAKERELEEIVIEADAKLKQYVNLDTLEKQLKIADKAYKDVEKLVKQEDKLLTIKLKLHKWKEKKKEWKRLNELIESVDLKVIEDIKKEYLIYKNLKQIISRLERVSESLMENKNKMADLKKSYEKTLMRAGKLLLENKICPTCFKPLEEKEVDKIVEKRYKI